MSDHQPATDILLVTLPLSVTAAARQDAIDALSQIVERFLIVHADVSRPTVEAVPRRCTVYGTTSETPEEVAERVERALSVVNEAVGVASGESLMSEAQVTFTSTLHHCIATGRLR